MKASEKKDSVIAWLVTMLFVAAVLIWLWFTTLSYDARLASAENPTLGEEELFLDPELLLEQNKTVGNPEATTHDTPSPEVKGEPVPSHVEQEHTVHPGDNKTAAPEQQLIATKNDSPVDNAASDRKKEEEKVASSMAGKFKSNPGSVAGKFDSAGGSDGSGTGVTGRLSGRQFLGCPLPDVELTHKTTVTVSITVDAEGRVTSATASGAATRAIRKKCEQAAMQARWSEKKGAASTRGTITFTIIPR